MKRSIRTLTATIFLGIALAGCAAIHTTNGRKVTQIEQVMVWNAGLANANLDLAKGIIAANESGVIDVPTSNAILTQQSMIANADRQLTGVLASVCSPAAPGTVPENCNAALLSGKAVEIQGFLTQIQTAAKNLVASGTVGIKNAQSQQVVAQAITTLNTLAGDILGGLQGLGVLK